MFQSTVIHFFGDNQNKKNYTSDL